MFAIELVKVNEVTRTRSLPTFKLGRYSWKNSVASLRYFDLQVAFNWVIYLRLPRWWPRTAQDPGLC